jgi:hypothetical protein
LTAEVRIPTHHRRFYLSVIIRLAAGPAISPAIAFASLAVLTGGPKFSTEPTVIPTILVVPWAILIHAALLISTRGSPVGINPNAAGTYLKTLRKSRSNPAQHDAESDQTNRKGSHVVFSLKRHIFDFQQKVPIMASRIFTDLHGCPSSGKMTD